MGGKSIEHATIRIKARIISRRRSSKYNSIQYTSRSNNADLVKIVTNGLLYLPAHSIRQSRKISQRQSLRRVR